MKTRQETLDILIDRELKQDAIREAAITLENAASALRVKYEADLKVLQDQFAAVVNQAVVVAAIIAV